MGLAEAMPPKFLVIPEPLAPPATRQEPRCQWVPLIREGSDSELNYGWQLRFRRDDHIIVKWQVVRGGKAKMLMLAARERLLAEPWVVYWEYKFWEWKFQNLLKRQSARRRRRRGVRR